MYRNLWKKCHASVCAINFFNNSGIKVLTQSGFKLGGLILTDKFNNKNNSFSEVQICFVEIDGITIKASTRLPFSDFFEKIIRDCEEIEESNGFIAIRADFQEFNNIPSLKYRLNNEVQIGEEIAALGFHFDRPTLCLKTGFVSSSFVKDNFRYIEFDSAINQGNSGGPLISFESCEVIGIVGYRLALLSKSYQQVTQIINDNINTLKDVQGKIKIVDIDPMQVLIANQNQMKHMAKEFYTSTNFSCGNALEISHVTDFLEENYTEFLNLENTSVEISKKVN